LKSREKLIVCEKLPVDDRGDIYDCFGTVFLERLRACGPEDAIRPELFNDNSKAILNRMTGLKELYIIDYTQVNSLLRRLPDDTLTLIFKKCVGLEYLCMFTKVLQLIPENELSLKYLCGYFRVKPLLSIMENSPSLEGLGFDPRNPTSNHEFDEIPPTLLTKLPFGLKWLRIDLKPGNLSSLFSSEAMKTLQDLSIDTYNSATDGV